MLSFAKPRRSETLAKCDQSLFLSELALTRGQCAGITRYWLCLHLLSANTVKNFDSLSKNESKLVSQIHDNFLDIMRIQQRRFELQEITVPVADFKIASLQKLANDTIFRPGECEDFNVTSKHPDDRVNAFISGVRHMLDNTAKQAYINFSYAWTDNVPPRGSDQIDETTGRRRLGHAIGFIKNPSRDCELLFFDCEQEVHAFTHAEDFYNVFAPDYYRRAFAHDGIPDCYIPGYLESPSLQAIQSQTRPLLKGIIQQMNIVPLEEIVIVTDAAPVPPSHVIDMRL